MCGAFSGAYGWGLYQDGRYSDNYPFPHNDHWRLCNHVHHFLSDQSSAWYFPNDKTIRGRGQWVNVKIEKNQPFLFKKLSSFFLPQFFGLLFLLSHSYIIPLLVWQTRHFLRDGDEINFPSRCIDLGRIRSLRLPVRSQITKVDGIASYFDIFGIWNRTKAAWSYDA